MAIKDDIFKNIVSKKTILSTASNFNGKSKYSHFNVFEAPSPAKKTEICSEPISNQSVTNIPFENNLIGTHQEHNKNTNWNTSGTHQEHIKNTNGTQQRHIRNTSGTHQEHVSEHNRNTTGTHQEHNRNTDKNTSGTHQEHNSNVLPHLIGIQRNLLVFFYESCKKNQSKTTESFAIQNIADQLNIRVGSVKESLRRLEGKGLIKAVDFKKGRGGWTKFELPNYVYKDLLYHEKEHNRNTDKNTSGTQQEHELEHIRNTYRNTYRNTTAPSSSSNDINKPTTTELPDEWKNINLSEIIESGVPFGSSQLFQVYELGNHTIEQVQDTLDDYAFDVKNGHLKKDSYINYLMSIFRKGSTHTSQKRLEWWNAEKGRQIELYRQKKEAQKFQETMEKYGKKEEITTS